MLLSSFQQYYIEAGCDEAGRGCLAGPVFAAAVIFPHSYEHELLNDSKILTAMQRYTLRDIIKKEALAFAVASASAAEIDEINILNASFLAMHRALDALKIKAEYVLVDGNRFKTYQNIPHQCIVKGDSKFLSIAAASILAKTYRDDYMDNLANQHPEYDWINNKGYPTKKHRNAVLAYGMTPHHRKTFRITDPQLQIDFE